MSSHRDNLDCLVEKASELEELTGSCWSWNNEAREVISANKQMNLDASRWRMLQLCRYLDSSAVLKYSIQNLFDNAVEKASEKKRTFSDHDAQPQEFHLRSVMISITCSTNLSSKVALGDKALVRKRRRKIHSPEIRAILEKEFSLDPSPSRAHRKSIAVRCNMSTSEVRIWVCFIFVPPDLSELLTNFKFANRRNRFKRYQ